MTAATLGLGLVVVVLIYAMGALVDLSVGLGGLTAATLGTVLFALLHGQLAMLAGALTGRRGPSLGVGWGVALGGYLLSVMAGIDQSLDWLNWLSPLHYATNDSPIVNGPTVWFLALLAALLLALGATVLAFRRHDLR
jgi:ABC-2 type transport system permease protein